MDVQIIEFLREISNPVFDWFFRIITEVGDQYFFIVVGAILFWTIDKKYAHKFVMTYLLVSLVNEGLKAIFKRPRPYLEDSITAPLGYETTGYSFPSGHSAASGVMGYTALNGAKKTGKKWIKYVGIAIMVLVPFSRMILAQHYFTDVLVGLVYSFFAAMLLFKLIDKLGDKEEYISLAMIPVLIVLMILVNQDFMYTVSAAYFGFAIGYVIEKYYVQYNVKNKFWIQVLKVVIGLIGAIAIKEGLKLVLPYTTLFSFIRYFFIGAWVTVGAPFVFKSIFKVAS